MPFYALTDHYHGSRLGFAHRPTASSHAEEAKVRSVCMQKCCLPGMIHEGKILC